jgi:C-terminal processing protease CtpA/Prc
MVVTGNLNRKDSVLKRGTFITSINGIRNKELIGLMFQYLAEDGYADNVNYIRLSSNFPYYHRNIIGLSKQYTVQYLDSLGNEKTIKIPLFEQVKDSSAKGKIFLPTKKPVKETKEQRLKSIRSLAIDTTNNTAIITLNSFTNGGLRKFFRTSFRYIKKTGINNVVLDIRSNGGGRINLSTLLTRYVTRVPFKVADTAFAVTKSLHPYSGFIKAGFINNLGLLFFTKKKADGLYHFGHWERKFYYPVKHNHYDGDLYVLINGSTFSASTLFSSAVKGQPGISLVGEEAGGGWHGNDGILIPDITLPNTHLRVRLPLFRIVQYKHVPRDGHGVIPDIYVGTSYEALVKGYDKKMKVVMEMIKTKNATR